MVKTLTPGRTIIFVRLLNEGTSVMRPTEGVSLADGTYRLLETPGYNPEDEHWEIPPGSVVRCIVTTRDGEEILIANELAQPQA